MPNMFVGDGERDILREGIFTIASDWYHADPCPEPSLSNSIACVLIEQSPMHARLLHPRLNPELKRVNKKEFDFGSSAHDMLLEGGTEKICVIQPEDYRSKPTKAAPEGNIPHSWTNDAIREARDLAYSNGLIPCLPWDLATIKKMVAEVHRFVEDGSDFKGIFQRGKPEQTVIWQEDNGVWCRARFDWLTDDKRQGLDYKSTVNSEPNAFARHMRAMRYAIQFAFYRRGVCNLTGIAPTFTFLAQEREEPYACSLNSLSNAAIEIADAQVERAIGIWGECLASGKWPGYGGRIHYHEPAAYELNEYLESMEQE